MNKTEQLSTSTQNPKIELPNKTLVGVKPTETKSEELATTPKPTGWRILVLPFKQKEKTKGGLILACLLYTSPSPRDLSTSRMPSSA